MKQIISKWFSIMLLMMAGGLNISASTVDDLKVLDKSYVLVCDQLVERPGAGVLFGDDHFIDITGGNIATNKGQVDLSVVYEDDDNHVTKAIADKYGAAYAGPHYNWLRLKNAQDVIAMKVTAGSKIIFFLHGNNKSGTTARIPKIATDQSLENVLNAAPGEDFPATDAGFRYEWTTDEDRIIYVGSYNGDMFVSFIIVEVPDAGDTPVAGPALTVDDVTIKAGETATTTLKLASDATVYGVQTDITLPEGISVTDVTATAGDVRSNTIKSGATRIVLLSLEGKAIEAGNVITLTLTAGEAAQNGSIKLSNTRLTTSTAGDEITVADAEATLTLESTPAPDPELDAAKEKLEAAIAYAKTIGAEELADAITAAKTALSAEDATVDSLTAAQAALVAAVKNYAQSALRNAIALAGEVAGDTGDLNDAITAATDVLNNAEASPQELMAALQRLQEAATSFAKTTLTKAIAAAKELDTTDKQGVDALNAAIAAAQRVLDNNTSTLAELYAAGVALKQAVEDFLAANTKPEAIIPSGTYYVLNAAYDEPQLLMAAGHTWGTKGIVNETGLDLDFAYDESTDTYTIDTRISNGGNNHFLGSNLWMDAAAFGWTIEGEFVYTISTVVDGVKKYIAVDANQELCLIEDGTADNAQWAFMLKDYWENEVKSNNMAALESATASAPVDASFLIKSPNFNRNDLRNAQNWTMVASNQNLAGGGENGNGCAESYHSTFELSQQLADAPAGIYALTAQGFYRQDGEDNDNLPVFFANDETATFPLKTGSENSMAEASASFSAGKYTIDPIYVKVEEGGTLTIGAKLETNTALWCIWDNFVLTYYGTDASIEEVKNAAIIKELADLRDRAEELKEEVEVEAVQTALDDALNATASVEGADAINAAIETMKTAIDKAEASVTAKNVLPMMKQLTENTNVYTQEAYEKYYGQWVVKYEDGSLTKDEANALQDPFVLTGRHANATANTLLMSVWDEPAYNWDSYHLNTWSTEGNGDGSNFVVPFIEYWTGDGNSLGEKTLTATMNNVPEGVYDITAWVRVRIKNGAEGSATGITLQANDGDPIDVCTGDQVGESQFYLKEFTAQGTVGEDGVLNIKFIVAADNNISWLSFQNVNYAMNAVYVAKVALQEEIDTATATADAAEDSDAKAALQQAISNAQAALAAADATVESLQQALADLKAAEDGFATATGITAVTAGSDRNAEVYNLNGQKVTKTQKGLYIVNGKKVIVK